MGIKPVILGSGEKHLNHWATALKLTGQLTSGPYILWDLVAYSYTSTKLRRVIFSWILHYICCSYSFIIFFCFVIQCTNSNHTSVYNTTANCFSNSVCKPFVFHLSIKQCSPHVQKVRNQHNNTRKELFRQKKFVDPSRIQTYDLRVQRGTP